MNLQGLIKNDLDIINIEIIVAGEHIKSSRHTKIEPDQTSIGTLRCTRQTGVDAEVLSARNSISHSISDDSDLASMMATMSIMTNSTTAPPCFVSLDVRTQAAVRYWDTSCQHRTWHVLCSVRAR